MKYIKLGKTQFSTDGLGHMTAKEFEETYKGKLGVDMKEAKKKLRKYFKKSK